MAARRRSRSHASGITGTKELKRLSNAVDRIARDAERLIGELARLERPRPRPARRQDGVKAATARKK